MLRKVGSHGTNTVTYLQGNQVTNVLGRGCRKASTRLCGAFWVLRGPLWSLTLCQQSSHHIGKSHFILLVACSKIFMIDPLKYKPAPVVPLLRTSQPLPVSLGVQPESSAWPPGPVVWLPATPTLPPLPLLLRPGHPGLPLVLECFSSFLKATSSPPSVFAQMSSSQWDFLCLPFLKLHTHHRYTSFFLLLLYFSV